MTPPPQGLTDAELTEGLRACLSVQRWIDDVLARAPFSSLLELLDVAAAAASPLSPVEIDEALAAHPRIGSSVADEDTPYGFLRREQPAIDPGDEPLQRSLAEGSAAYERTFGRIFVVRTAGRDGQAILAELQRRLGADPETELRNVEAELRDIALLRIPKLFA